MYDEWHQCSPWPGFRGPSGALEQTSLMIYQYISEFTQGTTLEGQQYPPTLDIFETEVATVLQQVEEYTRSGQAMFVDYEKEHDLIHVLADIRSELAMISSILGEQKDIVDELTTELLAGNWADAGRTTTKDASSPHFQGSMGVKEASSRDFNRSSSETLVQLQKRVTKIDDDAERIEKIVADKLNLKRAYATIQDTHHSLLLSTAVIGFTVITIVFAPLAFVTALFALNIEGFQGLRTDNATNAPYKSGKMAAIFGEWLMPS